MFDVSSNKLQTLSTWTPKVWYGACSQQEELGHWEKERQALFQNLVCCLSRPHFKYWETHFILHVFYAGLRLLHLECEWPWQLWKLRHPTGQKVGVLRCMCVYVWECILTLVVLTLFPVLQLQPVRSGRTLHSSPSKHGCIWHHHFWATIDATHTSQETWTNTPRLVQTETLTSYKYRDHIMEWGKTN